MTIGTGAEPFKSQRDRIELHSSGKALPLILLLAMCIALFAGLGIWQLHRLAWKRDLIASVVTRMNASAVPIPSINLWDDLVVDELIYQRVELRGVFDHDAEVQSLAVTELGPGFWVMTPLILEKAGVVLINRGFVPQALKESASRSNKPPSGSVEVTGLLRATEPGGGFLRKNDPSADRWFSRDTVAIGEAQQLPKPIAPFFVDAEIDADATSMMSSDTVPVTSYSSDIFPRAGMTVTNFRNTHLAYALTWFTLSVMACGGIYLVLTTNTVDKHE